MYIEKVKNNAFQSKKQANEYVDQIMDCIREIMDYKSGIKRINL